MKINKTGKWILLLISLCSIFFLTACGQKKEGQDGHRSMIVPAADGKKTLEAENLIIDISHLDLGYLMVKYTGSAPRLYVQLAGEDQEEYKYFLEPSRDYVTLPLTAGEGEYYLGAYENIGGDHYSPILSQLLSVELSDKFGPFLCSNQYVDFTKDSQAVQLAAELTADITDDLEKVQEIYRWVVRNVEYDYDKAASVSTGYLPNVDNTLKSKKGICFDYAALMTAMLRSLGIPTKLNIGYLTGDTYHAWISVYLDEVGWVDNLIQFDGKDWQLMDPTVASSAGNQEVKSIASDDANYIVRYVR